LRNKSFISIFVSSKLKKKAKILHLQKDKGRELFEFYHFAILAIKNKIKRQEHENPQLFISM
jgi:hypothetical protein